MLVSGNILTESISDIHSSAYLFFLSGLGVLGNCSCVHAVVRGQIYSAGFAEK